MSINYFEHEAWTGVVDISTVTLLEKTDFIFLAGISDDSSVVKPLS